MKYFLLFLVTISIDLLYSQNIILQSIDGNEINDDTLKIFASSEEFDFRFDILVFNTSNNAMDISMTRHELDVLPNTSSYFCWSVCTGVMTSGDQPQFNDPGFLSLTSNPSATGNTNLFTLHHDPNNNTGTSLFKIVFYDVNNPLDSSVVYCELTTYDVAGIDESAHNNEYFIFPNPCSEILHISEMSEMSTVYSLDGLIQAATPINNTAIDVSKLASGTYVLKLKEGSRILFVKE